MAFIQNDLYLASGTGQLINSWVDPVYKFDSSSFYNWEQDNLPIYDLEDRDDFLHEMAGYPASAAPSIMLTVSDCGVDNKKVFATVSGALEALPNTIRQPVIIEVCVSGQLGDLRLENKECVASGGGIEIINRGFGKMLSGDTATPSGIVYNTELGAADGSAIYIASSLDTSNTLKDTISVGLQVRVGNKHATTDTFWNSFGRRFVMTPEWSKAADTGNRGISVTSKFLDVNAMGSTLNQFAFTTYQDNSVSSDIIIKNPTTSTTVTRPNFGYTTSPGTGNNRATGFIYNNCLSKVSVKNCSGKIYIRGFCVDGATAATITGSGSQRTGVGFDIEGSDVVLENCTATRCTDAGAKINNSNVILNRGFLAYHNYELQNLDGGYLNTKNPNKMTAGLMAVNSNITLSAAHDDDLGLPIDSPFTCTRNMIGVDLDNSRLETPFGYRFGTNTAGVDAVETLGSQTLFMQTSLNVHEGIRATQSVIENSGYLSSYMNKIGVSLTDSTLRTAEMSIDHNEYAGLESTNSTYNYNHNAQLITRTGPLTTQTRFDTNGQHVNLDGSQFVPTQVSGMDSSYGRLSFNGVFQVDGKVVINSVVPSVHINNSSYMNAVGSNNFLLNSAIGSAAGTPSPYFRPTFGAAYSVDNGSTLDLNGMNTFATNIVGPRHLEFQQPAAGVCATNGSTVNIAGPTSISQYGVDVLGSDNSTINIRPHHNDGALDVSGYDLIGKEDNHTKVQLHATRACLVVKDNSTLNMVNLGDYHSSWDPKYTTGSPEDYPTGIDKSYGVRYLVSGAYTGGSIQFYPNPFVGSATFDISPQAGYPTQGGNLTIDSNTWDDVDFPVNTTDISGVSFGGMCVRAVGESTVKAQNVTFPTGWLNTSGAYYDLSSSVCEHLRIWNIADHSELHASYLTVSNSHPQDMSGAYWGPSALWTSDTGTGLSGAPSSTPDTSGASVLDSFGQGIQTSPAGLFPAQGLGYYGKESPENIGPFRIYVSPTAKAKFLGYPQNSAGEGYMPPQPPVQFVSMGFNFDDSGGTMRTGVPYQVLAQGYNASGDCSAINNQGVTYNNPSAIYQDLGFSAHIMSLPIADQQENVASSFFYASAMLPCDSQSRIWLDESAMNTFANAKNGTLGTSGRKKIFNYYKVYMEQGGESFFGANTAADMARGIGSASLFDLERYL